MSFDFEGMEGLKLQFSRLAEIPNLANEELKACAEEVAQKARDMAPWEYEDLMKAIQVGRRGAQGAGGRFVAGVSNYDVFINLNHPTQHETDSGTVREYAWLVHEHMGYGSTPGTITMKNGQPLMPNPQRNRGPHGEERGGHFLDRALLELEQGIYARVRRKVFEFTE